MTSVFSTKVTKVYNALINRINSSINTHNSNSSAHSDIRNSIPTKTSDLTTDNVYTKTEINTIIGEIEQDMLS